jgi:D-alanine-D-alanine ligase
VAYGPGEIMPGNEFYDFEAKYHSPRSRTTELADLDPELLESIRAAAVEVFLVIGGSGFARVDMLLTSDGIPYISEINTLPGFTPISLFPRMTAMGGYDFAATCERIVELALARAAERPTLELRPEELP